MTTRSFYRLFRLLALSSATWSATAASAQRAEHINDLRGEHLENPLGVDALSPRMSWRLAKDLSGTQQVAYQIQVGVDSVASLHGKNLTWTSGWTSSAATLVRYSGTPLKPFTKYYWRVRVKDNTGKKVQSALSNFETGILSEENWSGEWISDQYDIHAKPAPYFRKSFAKKNKKLRSARAYIASAGLHSLHINGKRIGDHQSIVASVHTL